MIQKDINMSSKRMICQKIKLNNQLVYVFWCGFFYVSINKKKYNITLYFFPYLSIQPLISKIVNTVYIKHVYIYRLKHEKNNGIVSKWK